MQPCRLSRSWSHLARAFTFQNLLFLEITHQFKTRACQKKINSHFIYQIKWAVKGNYLMAVRNKVKFGIIGLGGRLVKFKDRQVSGKPKILYWVPLDVLRIKI